MDLRKESVLGLVILGMVMFSTSVDAHQARTGVVSGPTSMTILAAGERVEQSLRLPPAHVLPRRSATRTNYRSNAADEDRSEFREFDLSSEAQTETAGGRLRNDPELQRQLAGLLDLRRLRGGKITASERVFRNPGPDQIAHRSVVDGDRDTPWSTDQLLADATNMNDQYLTLQVSPDTGHLYAVFEAYDLGGSDRDIHIARSTDGGVNWQIWEMPSFSHDEYHPDLAIDAAGYLHVVWIRADGFIMRARSQSSDDPVNWAHVLGFEVGEPCATPSIAVSGAGAFATVFIATSWQTVNWDLYQYEWTLLWLYSTNGGQTCQYDYLQPDGYQDLWPDVALSGGTAYMVNGEQDYYSGVVRIILAGDAVSGAFVDTIDLTSWTEMSSGFPSIAAEGGNVYCVYQNDYDDGLGNIDGDVIYSFSWDGLENVYGPYGMAMTESESVGPSVYVDNGIVGCVWLEAPAGGDQFDLAAAQGGLNGHPDFWSEMEIVTEAQHVEPQFHSGAGAAFAGQLHAGWIDRRDYPTQGLNVYTSRRAAEADLAPFAPEGWEAELVANMAAGVRQSGPLGADQPFYVSFGLANTGLSTTDESFRVALNVDGQQVAAWDVAAGLETGTYLTIEDHELTLGAGAHTIGIYIDTENMIDESSETNNRLSTDHVVLSGDPQLMLTPASLHIECAEPRGRAQVLDVLAHSPPTRREVQLPVMGQRLAAEVGRALQQPGSGERFRVVVIPAERIDTAAMTKLVRGIAPIERRDAVVAALKHHQSETLMKLQPVTGVLAAGGQLTVLNSLWLSGELIVEATAEALQELAVAAEIGSLWLDDRKSEMYSTAGVADSRSPGEAPQGMNQRTLTWHLTRIGADAAWAQGYDGSGILIGHTDSGVCYDHPDLVGRMWDGGVEFPNHGWDFIDEDNDPYDGDTGYWHGTHTAGLAVGDGHNGTSTGAAPGATLMAVRCVPGYYEDMVESLQFCIDNGARVITTSAGWSIPPDGLRSSNRANAELLLAIGIPWVCAAGNGDNYGGHYEVPLDLSSPGDCPHPWYGRAGHSAVFSVGAATAGNGIWANSSYGPTAWEITGEAEHDDYPYSPGLIKPDLAAPGVDVTSTFGPASYQAYSGSSMATPLVAGAIAVLLQTNEYLDPIVIGQVLEESALDIAEPGRDNTSGAGLLDIPSALASLPEGNARHFWAHSTGVLPLLVESVVCDAAWLTVSSGPIAVASGDSTRFTAAFDSDGLPTGVYQTEIIVASNDPDSPHHLPVTMTIGNVTSVDDSGLPSAFATAALDNYPNPFNPRTVLSFSLSDAGAVRLCLYDLQGRMIRRLVAARLASGPHEIIWDGHNDDGLPLPSGVYLARLETPSGVSSRKMALLR